LSKDEHRAIHLFRRAADYIAAGAHILTLLTHINKYPFQQ
jgi:hypothetical protein